MKPSSPETTPALPAVHSGGGDAPASVTAASADDGRADYTVTDLAGPRIAGQLVKAKGSVRLTEAEALAELLAGTIVRKGEKLHEMFTRRGPPAAADKSS